MSGQTGRLPSTADDTGLDEDLDLNVGPDSSVSAEDTSSVLTDLEQSDLELRGDASVNDQSELTSEVGLKIHTCGVGLGFLRPSACCTPRVRALA